MDDRTLLGLKWSKVVKVPMAKERVVKNCDEGESKLFEMMVEWN